MDFLKRHYEKVILLGLFVFFIGLMYLVQTVINSTREVTPEQLALPKRVADYNLVKQDDPGFNTDNLWKNSNLKWDKIAAGKGGNDFVAVVEMVSVKCDGCNKSSEVKEQESSEVESLDKNVVEYISVIPKSDFKSGSCSVCGGELKKAWRDEVDIDAEAERLERLKAEKSRREEEEKHREERLKKEQEEEKRIKEELARLEDDEQKIEDEKKRQEEDVQRSIEDEFKRQEEEIKRQEEEKKRQEEEKKRQEEEKKRQEEEEKRRKEEIDRDGDGISNEDEKRFGMDENDENDIYYDNDGDGFSNIFELENGYWPNDPLDHPPLWWRLKVKEVRRSKLDAKFMALNDGGSDDKTQWSVQFNHRYVSGRLAGRWTSSDLYIGSTFEVEKDKFFKVVDIKRIITEKKRAATALEKSDTGIVVEKIDNSLVIMDEVVDGNKKPERLEFPIKADAFSYDYRPVLTDTGRLTGKRREIHLKPGETFRLGLLSVKDQGNEIKKLTRKELSGEVRAYRLKSVDDKKLIVEIEEVLPAGATKKPELFVITREGKVPAKKVPTVKKQKQERSEEERVLTLDAPLVRGADEDNKTEKKEGSKKADPNAPRRPLIGERPADGSPRPSIFSNAEEHGGNHDMGR